MLAALSALEEQEIALQREVEAPVATAERITPDLAELYRSKIERLGERQDSHALAGEDGNLIRRLIDRVTVSPATGTTGLSIELEGDIVAMIGMAWHADSGRKRKLSAGEHADFMSSVQVVAGTGNHRQLTPIRLFC